jgi:DNA-binding response OmpR family regulator
MDAGADDYVIKPFSPRELVTRLHAILRRSRLPNPREPQFVFDELTIDTARREVFVAGVELSLPAKEFDLLAFLAASPKQVFTRIQLMNHVWGTDAAVSTATVTEHIRRLRQRIEPDPRNPRWIQTVWSVGYRFTP